MSVGTGAIGYEAVFYGDDIAVIVLFVLSIADVRNQDFAGRRDSEFKAFVLRSAFVSSALFGRCDTLYLSQVRWRSWVVANPPIRCSNTGSFLHDR